MWAGVLIGAGTLLLYKLVIQRMVLDRIENNLYAQMSCAFVAVIIATALLVGTWMVSMHRGECVRCVCIFFLIFITNSHLLLSCFVSLF